MKTTDQRTFLYLAGSMALPSRASVQGLEPLDSLKSTHTHALGSGSDGQMFQTLETSPTSQPHGLMQTCSRAAGRVSHFQSLGQSSEKETIGTSGRQCFALYPKSGQLGLLVKTLLTAPIWFSPDASMIWKVSAISPQYSIYRLALLAYQAWNGTCGLLPRACASDWKGVRKRIFRTSDSKEKYSASGGRLPQALRAGPEDGIYPCPAFYAVLKGFPDTWGELSASEMPSRRQSRTSSQKPSTPSSDQKDKG